MISRGDILKLETRREIYNFILEHPGLHLREISRRTNISFGGLRYHLDFLKKQELVTTKSNRRYIRYYVTQKVGKIDKEIINLLRQEVPRKIFLLMLCAGPGYIYQKPLRDVIGPYAKKPDPAIYSGIYSKRELVELTRYWNRPYGGLFHLRKHRTTIDFHLNKLLDAGLIEKVPVGKEIKYKIKDEVKDEDMIWAFLIKYQKALSNELIDRMLDWHWEWIEKRIDAMIEVAFDILPPFLPFPIN